MSKYAACCLAAVLALCLFSCENEPKPQTADFPVEQFKRYLERRLLSFDWLADGEGPGSIKSARHELEDYVRLIARYTIVYYEGSEESVKGRYFRDLLETVDWSDFKFVDINSDGTLEILIHASHGSNMEKELTVIWRTGNMLNLRYHSHALLKDIDGDGKNELVVLDVLNYGGAAGDFTVCWEDIYVFNGAEFFLSNERFKEYYGKEKEWFIKHKQDLLEWQGQDEDESGKQAHQYAIDAVDKVLEKIDRVLAQ